MALNATPASAASFQPLPVHEHNRPISQREDNGLAGFEQLRQQLAQAGRLPHPVGAGTARPEGAPGPEPTGVRTVPPVPTTGVHAPNRPPAGAPGNPPARGPEGRPGVGSGATAFPPLELGHIRELLEQAAGRTQLAALRPVATTSLPPEAPEPGAGLPRAEEGFESLQELGRRPEAGLQPLPGSTFETGPVTPPAAPRPGAPPAPREIPRLIELGPEIAQVLARARLQAAAENQTARSEGTPGVAPRPRVLVDQLL